MALSAALSCGNPAAASGCSTSGCRRGVPAAAAVRASAKRGSLAVAHSFTSPLAAASVQPMPDPFPGQQAGDDLPEEYGSPGPNPPKHRRAGVVLHPTSLPGKFGMGEIGAEALRFVDWLAETGMQLWQVGGLTPVRRAAGPGPRHRPAAVQGFGAGRGVWASACRRGGSASGGPAPQPRSAGHALCLPPACSVVWCCGRLTNPAPPAPGRAPALRWRGPAPLRRVSPTHAPTHSLAPGAAAAAGPPRDHVLVPVQRPGCAVRQHAAHPAGGAGGAGPAAPGGAARRAAGGAARRLHGRGRVEGALQLAKQAAPPAWSLHSPCSAGWLVGRRRSCRAHGSGVPQRAREVVGRARCWARAG